MKQVKTAYTFEISGYITVTVPGKRDPELEPDLDVLEKALARYIDTMSIYDLEWVETEYEEYDVDEDN